MSELPIDKPGNALKAWLSQTPEKALEPGQAIIDPHHHLWDYPENRYLLDDLLEDTNSGHNVVSVSYTHLTLPTTPYV